MPVAVRGAKRPACGWPAMTASAPIVYRIDKHAEIVFVNQAWDEFAKQNNGLGASSAAVLNRSLWSFVGDASLRGLYHQIVERVRQGANLKFGFRCDSASMMRWFEMQVIQVDDDLVEFRSELLKEQERRAVPLLDVDQVRAGASVKACSICLKLQIGERWLSMEEALAEQNFLERESLPELRHEICRPCFESMYEEVTGPKHAV